MKNQQKKSGNFIKKLNKFKNKVLELHAIYHIRENILLNRYPEKIFFDSERNLFWRVVYISLYEKFCLELAKFFDGNKKTFGILSLIEAIPNEKIYNVQHQEYENKIKIYKEDVKKLIRYRNDWLAHRNEAILFNKSGLDLPDDKRLEKILEILVGLVDNIACDLRNKRVLAINKPEFSEFHQEVDKMIKECDKDYKYAMKKENLKI